ncbi:hypothetical protein DERF_010560 [Dermatophagoides farinae]|uniref:Uncharacterized protein n=1 Tax=Dermatophagoides farinae TaxID=6954 RepID=A0A922HYP1_DERFA|nr:hypothetical protein DERF_010560 [Dermatophagoides farinae]
MTASAASLTLLLLLLVVIFSLSSTKSSNIRLRNGDCLIFSSNKSFLFKNNINDVLYNNSKLVIIRNKHNDSCIRFTRFDSIFGFRFLPIRPSSSNCAI